MGVGCFCIKQVVDLATGAGGTAGGLVMELDPANFLFLDNGNTTGIFNIPGAGAFNPTTQNTTIQALYKRYRPVSAGLRATYVGSTMNDQGTVTVAQYPGSYTPVTLNGGSSATAFNAATFAETYPLKMGAEITWRPEDPEDYQFQTFTAASSSTTSVATNGGIPWLFVGFTGAQAATGALRVEVVVNFEGELYQQTFTPGGNPLSQNQMTRAEPGWYEKAANLYRRVLPYTAGGAALLKGAAGSTLGSAASVAALTAGIPGFINFLGSRRTGMKMLTNGSSSIYDLD